MALEALKAYSDTQKNQSNSIPPKTNKEPVNNILTANMEMEKHRLELYGKLADNIKVSEQLRCKINKDVKQGAEVFDLLIDAIKCISLMTGDTVFYEQNSKALRKREP